MLAKNTWKTLCQGWNDIYLGPSDIVTHIVGTNFDFIKFHTKAKIFNIICHQILIKAY